MHSLERKNPRFHAQGYLFLLSALDGVVRDLTEPRHISGHELSVGVRELAMDRFGPMARTVLEHWGVHSTRDLGEMVYTLVECGLLVTQEGDSVEDFAGVFDFEEAFEQNYPWAAS